MRWLFLVIPCFALLPVSRKVRAGGALRVADPALDASLDLDQVCRDLGLTPVADALVEEEAAPSLDDGAAAILEVGELLRFTRAGHLCTRALLTREEVDRFASPLRAIAVREEARTLAHAYEMNDEAHVAPFLQSFNTHRRNAAARSLAHSPRLAGVAAQLLGTERLRLYQDCIFRKRPGDASTNWHSDLHTSPIDSNDFVTAWIPLMDVPEGADGGTGLQYADGSHRDLALLMWYGSNLDASTRYQTVDHGALAVGDVSWHHGWTLHSAPPNAAGNAERFAFAISYFADGARVVDEIGLQHINDEDSPSYEDWLSDIYPGEIIDHALLPVVFGPKDAASS